jgi:hypothetical protein
MKQVKKGGITYGRSHKNGGIPVQNRSTGEMLEVEGGEGIVNKRSMASDKKVKLNGQEMTICEAVSQLNTFEGGVKFDCDDVSDRQFIEEMANGGQLERGKKTEQEHIKVLNDLYAQRITPKQAINKIAKDHLDEDPFYYSKLEKIEKKMSNGGLIAPNGKKSNLTAEQYKLVRTPQFKKWFGDWENDPENASKVVDENGEPLVVFHNSDNIFNVFDLSYFGKSDGGYAGVGFYFVRKSIKGYGQYLYQCFLSIKNPLVRTSANWKDSFMPYVWIPNRANELKEYTSIRNASAEWTKEAKKIGFDGFIDEGGEIVAFYSEQIKLADGSNTTFGSSNPDIRFADGGLTDYENWNIQNKETMKQGGQTKNNPFAQFGLKKSFQEDAFDRIDKMLAIDTDFCKVKPEICTNTIDIDRSDMPQIYDEYIDDYVDFLESNGIDYEVRYDVKVSNLKPTQKNISLERMKKTMSRLLSGYYTDNQGKKMNPLSRRVIATKDGFLLDGHHRWATSLFLSPENEITVLQVNANIEDLIPISKKFGMAEFQKFMFGGKIETIVPNTQSEEEIKTFTAYRGGFPAKGVVVTPLFLQYSVYSDKGFTISIAKANMQTNSLYMLLIKIKQYLDEQIKKTGLGIKRIEGNYIYFPYMLNRTYEEATNTMYLDRGFKLSVGEAGKKFVISIAPFQTNSMDLLENDEFLNVILDAINSQTNEPNKPIVIPTQKTPKAKVDLGKVKSANVEEEIKQAASISTVGTESLIDQEKAIQVLMQSFSEDETKVRSYLRAELNKLAHEKERIMQSQFFSTDFSSLLDLYASKVSLSQRKLNKNACGLSTPSGEPSELDALQYNIVRTPAFKNWFGDWETAYMTQNYNGVSKAINKKTGEPLVMYHGKSNMKSERTELGFNSFPIKYFAEDVLYSEYFANRGGVSALYEFFIKCDNPMDLTKIHVDLITPNMFKTIVEVLYGYEIKSRLASEETPLRVWQILRGNPAMLNEIREKTNFDGFTLYEDNPDPNEVARRGLLPITLDFAVFSANQIKAADGRNTTFLLDVKDFRFAKGGMIKN